MTIERARARNKRFVLLQLPTGTGKSALAIAAGKWAAAWGNGAYVLSPQKLLTAQYMRDFENCGLVELRGRSSYLCADFHSDCEQGAGKRGKDTSLCLDCPYKKAKDYFVSQKLGVTNFDYFLAETLYSGQLPKRSLLILDEAHNLEQKVLGFTDFEVTPFALQKYSMAIPSIEDGDVRSALDWVAGEMVPSVGTFIESIPEGDEERQESRREAQNLLSRMRRFIEADTREWACWNDGKKLVFRPLSSGKYASDFLFSRAEMIVIMSATILDANVFCRTLHLAPSDCEYIAVDCDFPVENRPIFYKPVGSMSFQNKNRTLPKIAEALDGLLRAHPSDKGLVHTNSYEMNRFLTNALSATGHKSRIVTHGPGGGEAAIERHINTPGPTVLFSPAMTEGVDLRDDLSRFQALIKVPYPRHTDPYVAARMRLDKRWYAWQTAMKLIQATGRSVRSETDFAQTYIFDSDFTTFCQRNKNLLPKWWLDAVVDSRTAGS